MPKEALRSGPSPLRVPYGLHPPTPTLQLQVHVPQDPTSGLVVSHFAAGVPGLLVAWL